MPNGFGLGVMLGLGLVSFLGRSLHWSGYLVIRAASLVPGLVGLKKEMKNLKAMCVVPGRYSRQSSADRDRP